jgi:hypothetical protein
VALEAVNVGERDQGQSPATLEELLADRIAAEAARIAEERVREAFAVTEFDPDEVHGFMDSRQAAAFLVHLQHRSRVVSYSSGHENSNLRTLPFGKGA